MKRSHIGILMTSLMGIGAGAIAGILNRDVDANQNDRSLNAAFRSMTSGKNYYHGTTFKKTGNREAKRADKQGLHMTKVNGFEIMQQCRSR